MNFTLIALVALIISACVDQSPAPIIYGNNPQATVAQPNSSDSTQTIFPEDEIIRTSSSTSSTDQDKIVGSLKAPKNKEKEEDYRQPTVDEEPKQIIYHEAQPGETIRSIAQNYDQLPEDIAQLNDLQVDEELEPSQLIKIKVTRELLNKKNKELTTAVKQPPRGTTNFTLPVDGKVIVHFGAMTKYGRNNGINIAAPPGAAVKSMTNGIIMYNGNDARFGHLILVKSTIDNLYIAYAHLNDVTKAKGDEIKQGEIIGHVGSTGQVDAPQLYLAIKENNKYVDPLKYLSQYK